MRTRGVNLLVDAQLPPEFRDPDRTFDQPSVRALMSRVAVERPELYPALSKHLMDLGRKAAYQQGRTLGLDDLEPLIDRDAVLAKMDAEVAALRKATDDPEEFEDGRIQIWTRYNDLLKKMTMEAAKARGHDISKAVLSGARGKPEQLQMMVTTPGVYQDHRGRVAPLFVRNSYREGLRPAEFLASTFGARFAVLSTKVATAKGGDFGKQAVQAAARLPVTIEDCGTTNGIAVDAQDDDQVRFRTLARPVGGLEAGYVVRRRDLPAVQQSKTPIIVRSVMTCEAPEGVCAKCYGGDSKGQLPETGTHVGVTSAQAVSEPVTQGSLNEKHSGGVAKGKKEFSGLNTILQFAQAPEEFPDRSIAAEVEGMVDSIEDAPQGGSFVTVGGQQHYVPVGYPILVKPGDSVEAGDKLSEGLEHPGDMLRLRGLGEGRRFYATRFKKILDDSGMKTFPRNAEILARAAIDHVRVTDADGLGDAHPDDVISYAQAVRSWELPATVRRAPAAKSVGKYLARPALHFSVGTRLTPRMTRQLEEAGFGDVEIDDNPPPFEPEMVRLRTASHVENDWLAQQHTSYLKGNLQDAAERSLETDTLSNVHFAPRLAVGVGFGEKLRQTGKY